MAANPLGSTLGIGSRIGGGVWFGKGGCVDDSLGVTVGLGSLGGGAFVEILVKGDFEDEALVFTGPSGFCGASCVCGNSIAMLPSETDKPGAPIVSEDVVSGSMLDCPVD